MNPPRFIDDQSGPRSYDPPDYDPIKELCDAIEASGGRLSFSIWCRSGLVGGRANCLCWRCCGRPQAWHDDDSPAELAAQRAARSIDRARSHYPVGEGYDCMVCGLGHFTRGGVCPRCGTPQPYLEYGGEA